nr:G protein-coupled receptor [Proales similis]
MCHLLSKLKMDASLSIRIQTAEISKYYGLAMGPLGVVLNIFSALIFFGRKRLNDGTNMGLICGMIAVADAIYLLLTAILFAQLLPGFGILLLFNFEFICRTGYFLMRVSVHMSSWLQVFISFERFMLINYPAKSAFLRPKQNVMAMIGLIFVALCLINGPNFSYSISSLPIKINGTNITIKIQNCTPPKELSVLVTNLTMVFRTFLPALLMLIFNVKTIRKIVESRRASSSAGGISRADFQFAITVFILNSLFFLSYLPIIVEFFYENVVLLFYPSYDPLIKSAMSGYYINFALMVAHTYQSLTFVINFIVNRIFRNELLFLMGIKKEPASSLVSSNTRSSRKT